MHFRLILAAALAVGLYSLAPAQAQSVQALPACGSAAVPLGPGGRLYTDVTGNLCINLSGSATGIPTSPAGITRTRTTCTLPAYATGGNVVCTAQDGTQTTTACAANTACLISAANANRKVALFMNRTTSGPIDVGYTATVAPGTGVGIADTSGVANGQGGSLEEIPAHVGTYYAASAAASALVFVQGQ